MREILFRGKVKNTNEWQYGDLRHWTKKSVGIHHQELHTTLRVIPETVGQYTGLTDKNGKKIFEKDIVKVDNGKYIISFDKGCWVILGEGKMWDFLQTNSKDCEIIGNLYDNPELLGEQNG